MILVKGHIRNVSNLETNVFMILDTDGTPVGELSIYNNILVSKLEEFVKKLEINRGNTDMPDGRPKNPVKIPITLSIKEE